MKKKPVLVGFQLRKVAQKGDKPTDFNFTS